MVTKTWSRRADYPRIAVIGCGISGMAMGIKLLRAGVDTFDIFEAESGVGGTWRVNTYPGASVDVHSLLYQFSFKNNPWRRTHATQDELLRYLEDTAREYGLYRHVRFDTPVEAVRWNESVHEYELVTANGQEHSYEVVVSCVGFLTDPNFPTWPGIDEFQGAMYHTTQLNRDVDLTGKRVAIVGVGSTSVQIVPTIAPVVDRLYIYQREPGWILPKPEREFSESELHKHSSLLFRKLLRLTMVIRAEWSYLTGPVYIEGNRRNRKAEETARSYINSVFKDRDDLRAAVTPTYPFSGKRRVLSSDFYPTLLRDNVELVPHPVVKLDGESVVDAEGDERQVDVLVCATGFQASRFLSRLGVYGRDGRSLQEVWRDGAYALVGMTVPGFPNFYMLYGPNTNGGGSFSIFWNSEQQANWVVRDVKRMVRRQYTAIESKSLYVKLYNRWMQRRIQRTAWVNANNYMKASSGKIVTQFAGGISLHWLLLRVMRPLASFGRRLQCDRASGTQQVRNPHREVERSQ